MAEYTEALRRKVLVVEDEFLVGLELTEALKAAGCEIVGPVARLGDAVRVAEAETALSLGVLDVNLAGELSWPVARALKSRQIPFVFVTGYGREQVDVPPELGDVVFLSKPVQIEDLLRSLEQAAGAAVINRVTDSDLS
jgi:CheY-like chemotaxis protein